MQYSNHRFLFLVVVAGSFSSSVAFAGCNSGNAAASKLLSDAACQASATGNGATAVGFGAVAIGDSQTSVGTNAGGVAGAAPFSGPNGGSTFIGVQAAQMVVFSIN